MSQETIERLQARIDRLEQRVNSLIPFTLERFQTMIDRLEQEVSQLKKDIEELKKPR